MSQLPHIIVGAGGHARVLIKTLQRVGAQILGLIDADVSLKGQFILGTPVLGADDVLSQYDPRAVLLVNGVGSTHDMGLRRGIYDRLREQGYDFAKVIHPTSFYEDDVELGAGAQIMAGTIVQTGCRVGANTIVNTAASIDHDCLIGAHCHVGPGAVLSGGVQIGDGTHIGVGSTIIQNIQIGGGSVIAAGSVVTESIPPGTRVGGVPARTI
jgi:sugar O-acyltransferase (sialic acid O-acetyltransferase NeuD family)